MDERAAASREEPAKSSLHARFKEMAIALFSYPVRAREMAVVHTLRALGFLQRVDSKDHRDGFMPIGTIRFGIQQP